MSDAATTAALERTDIVVTAPVIVDVDDYLDVRRPAWAALERSGAVTARDRKAYVNPELSEVLDTLASAFPAKYPPKP
jgi:hypothetical protein